VKRPEKRGAWSGGISRVLQKQREPDTEEEPAFKVVSLDKIGQANKEPPPKPKNLSGWEDVTGPLWRQNFEYHAGTNIVRCKICGVTARGLYFSNLKVHLNAKHTAIAECMNASIKKFADADDMINM
jgi:hypothetical protein